jgi:DNA-directed RNA polymerase subunit RPC12/RpoP
MVFKGCARCDGDMYREEDIGQTDLVCLQCGYRVSADRVPIAAFRGSTERQDRAGEPVRIAA